MKLVSISSSIEEGAVEAYIHQIPSQNQVEGEVEELQDQNQSFPDSAMVGLVTTAAMVHCLLQLKQKFMPSCWAEQIGVRNCQNINLVCGFQLFSLIIKNWMRISPDFQPNNQHFELLHHTTRRGGNSNVLRLLGWKSRLVAHRGAFLYNLMFFCIYNEKRLINLGKVSLFKDKLSIRVIFRR